ncbi:MAG TPA: hypothetical protein DD381_07095 [Lentisphaeria bacterium]|nr:MAG: hypothetical protein A2X47_10815 [Lentisphaerae bacterium GWF2_38_69]HBM16088.1 hypothetical protein [Lentisphaeria bacterium]
MKKILAFLLAAFILQAIAAPEQEKIKEPTGAELKTILSDFEKYAQKSMGGWKIPGMAIGIVQDGNLIYAKGFGVKRKGGSESVTENTIFQIGSTTKAFTALLAAMLQDEGKLRWNDRVIDHAPDFMMYDPWVTREFQIADLMAQHSGLPAYAADTLFFLGYDRRYIRHAIHNIKPVSSFRSEYAYQNGLWLVMAEIIEKYSGKTWEETLNERIFKPLNMTNSSADMHSFLNAEDVSSLHEEEDSEVRALPKNWDFLEWSYIAGPAGAINSNIVDMAKWLIFQMNNGKLGDKQLVSESNMQIIHSPKTIIAMGTEPNKNLFYCLGWIYQEHAPYPIIWHNGGTLMKTMVAYIPEQKIGIVILSNFITPLPEILAMRFLDQYVGNPVSDASDNALTEYKKTKKELEEKNPVRPENPLPSMSLEKYTGKYSNDVYGIINVFISGEKLLISIGPKNTKLTLAHWDKDIFRVQWPFGNSDETENFAIFQMDPNKNEEVTGVILDGLNQDDALGVFEKIIK